MQNKELAGPIEEIKSEVTDMNIEIKLFKYLDGKWAGRFGVRVRDLDAEENVGITVCLDIAQAERYYEKAFNG
jgi:hypothetical protein